MRQRNGLSRRGNKAFDIFRYQQAGERGSEQLVLAVAKDAFRRGIQALDAALLIQRDDAFVRCVEHRTLPCGMQRDFTLPGNEPAAHVLQCCRHIMDFVDVGCDLQVLVDIAVGDAPRSIAQLPQRTRQMMAEKEHEQQGYGDETQPNQSLPSDMSA